MRNCKECGKLIGESLQAGCATCLQYANACILLMRPIGVTDEAQEDIELQQSQVQQILGGGTIKVDYWLHELDMKQLYIYAKRIQATASVFLLAYQSKEVEARPSSRNAALGSDDYKEWQKKERIAAAPRPEKKQLSDWDKSVDLLVKVGVPREAAERSVNEQFAKMGKVTPKAYEVK